MEYGHNKKSGVGFHGPENLLHLFKQTPFSDDTIRLYPQ